LGERGCGVTYPALILRSRGSPPQNREFTLGAIFAVLGLVASLTMIRRDELELQTLQTLEKDPALMRA
jgi:hypothetical protein